MWKSSLILTVFLAVFLVGNYYGWKDRVEWLREINGIAVVDK